MYKWRWNVKKTKNVYIQNVFEFSFSSQKGKRKSDSALRGQAHNVLHEITRTSGRELVWSLSAVCIVIRHQYSSPRLHVAMMIMRDILRESHSVEVNSCFTGS